MNCPWHPNKRAVTSCKDCGSEFCIECVRETDQTTLCPDCFRRKISEITREFTEPAEKKDEQRAAPVSALPLGQPAAPAEEARTLFEEEAQPPAPRAAAAVEKKGRFGIKDRVRREKAVSEPKRAPRPAPEAPPLFEEETPPPTPPAEAPVEKKGRFGIKDGAKREEPASEPLAPSQPVPEASPQEDFLSQGPDEDFSQLAAETTRGGRWSRKARGEGATATETASAAPAAETVKIPQAGEESTVTKAVEATRAEEKASIAETAAPSEDSLLQDVMSTLLKPEAGTAEKPQAAAPESWVATTAEQTAPVKAAVRKREAKVRPEKDAERWSFLAQPRSSEYTLIAVSWWRATIFIALMLLLGAVLWAVPNAYLIPKDQEYGIHAVAIGAILGLLFWWKAGKKHSTKLAVQAALTTLFALFIGEFLHWLLIITKYDAFRTIFFDLISFRFLWENGADILRYAVEAMLPLAFLWLLLMPTITAFIIGFGMPPVPEIFFQIWHALKGEAPKEKEASHGLEG